MTLKKLSALLVTLGLAAASCSQGPESIETNAAAPDDTPPSSLAADDDEAQDGTNGVTLTPAPTPAPTTTEAATPPSTTANTVYDIGPAAGEVLDVVGVRYDDVLNIRNLPASSATIITTAAPFATTPQLISGGEGELIGGTSAWWKVTVDGTEGWVNSKFVGMISPTGEDLFPRLQASLMSVKAVDLDKLTSNIGGVLADGPTPLVVMSTEPVAQDAVGSEVTVDVIGIGDDSIKGWRLEIQVRHIFDDINGANPQIIKVELVSATGYPICGRGQSGTGICV